MRRALGAPPTLATRPSVLCYSDGGKSSDSGPATNLSESLGSSHPQPMGLRAAACHSPRKRSISTRTKERRAKERAALRRYRCARCGQLALVCCRCERNQIYCNRGCAQRSRLESQRRAGARHQRTALGRRNHADRQASYRRRQTQKVTHHTPLAADLPATPVRSGPTFLFGLPDKEDSDVCSRALPILSLTLVRAVAAQATGSGASSSEPPPPSSSLAKGPRSHRCHFCQQTSSRYLRRDFLVELSRRHRGRRERGAP